MSAIPEYIYNHNNIEDVCALVARYELETRQRYRLKSPVAKFIAQMINGKCQR